MSDTPVFRETISAPPNEYENIIQNQKELIHEKGEIIDRLENKIYEMETSHKV